MSEFNGRARDFGMIEDTEGSSVVLSKIILAAVAVTIAIAALMMAA